MKYFLALILLIISLTACYSTKQRYITVEKNEKCCTMKIPIGDNKETVELLFEYPRIELSYFSGIETAKNLKFLDIKLFVDGIEILPDKENYEAKINNSYRQDDYKLIKKEDCCANLEKLFKSQDKINDLLFVKITKTYKLTGQMPTNIEVLMTAITDQGSFEKRWKMKLETYEEFDLPIRFH